MPPPGWRPGDAPAANPFDGATDDADRIRRLQQAAIEASQRSGASVGVKFGKRKDSYLPYLVIRANAGDHGNRPISGTFWESPDIYVAPDLEAGAAPDVPTTTEGLAQAGAPNTLWAHVWNLGHAPVFNARVEFYWADPSMGISEASCHLIGVAYVDLGTRSSQSSNAIVKCPTTWVPTVVNGGHECLVVRVFEPLTDPLTPWPYDASNDRHVGQRNIHVADAHSPLTVQIPRLRLGCAAPPGPTELKIASVPVAEVPWLSVMMGKRHHGLTEAKDVTELVGFLPPTTIGSAAFPDLRNWDKKTVAKLLHRELKIERGCDELVTSVYVHVDGLKKGECKVYRVTQHAGGKLVGGYTIVARKLR